MTWSEEFPDRTEFGPIKIALFEATLLDAPFDARSDTDLQRALEHLGWTDKSVLRTEQVHGDRILLPGETGPADAFLIGPGSAAMIRHADCFPVAICDPTRGEAILAHCGWRGAVARLASKSARMLLSRGSRRNDLHVWIGPGIGPHSFEVGGEVLLSFPPVFHGRTTYNKASVDLLAFLQADLRSAGVHLDKIHSDPRDTYSCRALHSHRRDGAHAGRMATLCMIGSSAL